MNEAASIELAKSPQALAACRNLIFNSIAEIAGLVESYAIALGEAAWRGDTVTVEVHLRQLRACCIAAIASFKDLDGLNTKGGAA